VLDPEELSFFCWKMKWETWFWLKRFIQWEEELWCFSIRNNDGFVWGIRCFSLRNNDVLVWGNFYGVGCNPPLGSVLSSPPRDYPANWARAIFWSRHKGILGCNPPLGGVLSSPPWDYPANRARAIFSSRHKGILVPQNFHFSNPSLSRTW